MGDFPLMLTLLDRVGVPRADSTAWTCRGCTLSNSLTFVQCDACSHINTPLQSLYELFHRPVRERPLSLKSKLTNAVYDQLYKESSEEREFGEIVKTATGFQWRTGNWECQSCNNFNPGSRIYCIQCKRKNDCLEQLLIMCEVPHIKSAKTVEEDEEPEPIDNYIIEKLSLHRDFLTWTCPECTVYNPADYIQCASCLKVNEPLHKFTRALKAHCKKAEARFYERWLPDNYEVGVQETQKPMLLEFLEKLTGLQERHKLWKCALCTLLNSYEYVECRVCGSINTGLKTVLSILNLPLKPRRLSLVQEVCSAYYTVSEVFVNLSICPICENVIHQKDSICLSNCMHELHSNCLREYIEEQITSLQLPLHCPVSNCEEELQVSAVQRVLSRSQFRNFLQATLQHFLSSQGDKIKVCPTPDCPFAFEFQGSPYFSCPACFKNYCLRCQTTSHLPLSCEEFAAQQVRIEHCPQCRFQLSGSADFELCGTCGVEYCLRCGNHNHPGQNCMSAAAEKTFIQFAQGQGFKICGKCNAWVEKKAGGCNHIRCKCGYQFCYVCGKDWFLGQCQDHL